jgi:hypothetical protein
MKMRFMARRRRSSSAHEREAASAAKEARRIPLRAHVPEGPTAVLPTTGHLNWRRSASAGGAGSRRVIATRCTTSEPLSIARVLASLCDSAAL